jgi:hypothetical protein
MKRTIILLLILVVSATALAKEVPAAVKAAFTKKNPGAASVKWDKENAHEYEAGLKLEGKSYSANFSDTGNWLETESSIAFGDLPLKVQEAHNKAHKGSTVKAAAKIETAKGETKYEVEYKNGKKTKEAFYGEDGTVLK